MIKIHKPKCIFSNLQFKFLFIPMQKTISELVYKVMCLPLVKDTCVKSISLRTCSELNE